MSHKLTIGSNIENTPFTLRRLTYTITIDSTKIDEDLFDYPLMVKLTDADVLSQPRKNISIKTEDGSECYVEIEGWDNIEAVLWVKVPVIYSDIDTALHLSFLPQENMYVGGTLDDVATNVWSNGFISVFHLAGHGYDSCNTRNHATVDSDILFSNGKTGLGATFTNVSTQTGKIMAPDHPEYSPVNNDPVTLNGVVAGRICVQLQIKPTLDWLGSQWKVPIYKGYPIEYKWNIFGSEETYGGRRFYVFAPAGGYGVGGDIGATSGHLPTQVGKWYLLHGQSFHDPVDGGCLCAAYQDGEPGFGVWGIGGDVDEDKGFDNYTLGEGNPDGIPIVMQDTDSPLWIGNNPYQAGLDCVIDEVRISRVNRSLAWMKADYYSQDNQLVTINR